MAQTQNMETPESTFAGGDSRDATDDARIDELVAALRRVHVFADLPEEQLRWFAAHVEDRRIEIGNILFRKGDPAAHMSVYLEGEMQARRDDSLDGTIYIAQAGDPHTEVSGVLPFSRMTEFPSTSRAVTPVRVLLFPAGLFPEMYQRMPELTQRLVGLMSDRVRDVTRQDQQREKLAALGKISAGLAHELNNPAAAARRAAKDLRDGLAELREASARFCALDFTPAQRARITAFEESLVARSAEAEPLDSLTFSDREDEINSWLDERDLSECWAVAPMLVEANATTDELAEMETEIGRDALRGVLTQVTAQLSTARLTNEIEASTTRISELVGAIKEYTYMDQASVQEVDIHKGLESTLVILNHKIKKGGVTVERDYAADFPKITAYGSELNQVWTNLIDNAIDAMSVGKAGDARARELRIRTARKSGAEVCVEITDTGGGIPADLQTRIFEPFFTTKPVGEGTGLGLDTSYRIVRKHHGRITFDSNPGGTRFTIELPVKQPL